VARFEERVQAELRTSPKIADLCSAMAISQPTLLRAVRIIRGTTPSGYLRKERLAQAREELSSSTLETSSVTHVAMQFGFRELGRFAVDYREAFGERPSDTLRRSLSRQKS
jgi:AraC-like DNA-binding protein